METDLRKIEQLSRQREDENWRFRCYLKASDLPTARIDALVRRLYQESAAQIDCTRCGNCCRVMQPLLTVADIKRLADHHGMTVTQFRADFIKSDSDAGRTAVFSAMPCPFLQENRCSVYACRPRSCQSYPHLHKKNFVFRLSQAYANCSVCPIVFNVYEGLKGELWRTGKLFNVSFLLVFSAYLVDNCLF